MDMFDYNVHGLVHLAQDVRQFGLLESFSAFPKQHGVGCDSHRMESTKELDRSGSGSSGVWCLPRPPSRSKSGMACSTLSTMQALNSGSTILCHQHRKNSALLNFVTDFPWDCKGTPEDSAQCKYCNTDFIITHSGRSDITKHQVTKKHAIKMQDPKTYGIQAWFAVLRD